MKSIVNQHFSRRRPRCGVAVGVTLLAMACLVCGACSPVACGDVYCLTIGPPQTASGVGRAQGLDVRDGLVWIIGDAKTGVARAFTLGASDTLAEEGTTIALTVNGVNRAPHPTGLTYQDGVGTFMGDTVSNRGEILAIDWDTALAEHTLDHAILYALPDGAAYNGSRPELVKVDGRWLVATADYGNDRNELRIYDPDFLMTAANTDEAGVVVTRMPAPPYVQSLHYWEARDVLILVQNRHSGNGWKLTLIDLARSVDSGGLVVVDVLKPGFPGELEGFHFVDAERALMVTSAKALNAYVATLAARP